MDYLDKKIEVAINNIVEWHEYWEGKVYAAYSGGKDSTAMLHLIRSVYPDVPAVFMDTGLEFPEVRRHVKKTPNVITLRPKLQFHKVIENYGYPVISKVVAGRIEEFRGVRGRGTTLRFRNQIISKSCKIGGNVPTRWRYLLAAPFKISARCCLHLKKRPVAQWVRDNGNPRAFLGLMAEDSRNRLKSHQRFGCNAFKKKNPESRPIMSWTTADVWQYIKRENIEYPKVYDMGYGRTGCMFCAFGIHLDGRPNRFEQMKTTHPKRYDYVINRLGYDKVLDFLGVPY